MLKRSLKELSKLVYWRSKGRPQIATVSARLYSDIKKNGDKSAFVKVGPQTFALRGFR